MKLTHVNAHQWREIVLSQSRCSLEGVAAGPEGGTGNTAGHAEKATQGLKLHLALFSHFAVQPGWQFVFSLTILLSSSPLFSSAPILLLLEYSL